MAVELFFHDNRKTKLNHKAPVKNGHYNCFCAFVCPENKIALFNAKVKAWRVTFVSLDLLTHQATAE